jgi:hypothetical protein
MEAALSDAAAARDALAAELADARAAAAQLRARLHAQVDQQLGAMIAADDVRE